MVRLTKGVCEVIQFAHDRIFCTDLQDMVVSVREMSRCGVRLVRLSLHLLTKIKFYVMLVLRCKP